MRCSRTIVFILGVGLWALSAPVDAQGVNVLTQHNNNSRTGANLQETTLTPSTVSSSTFGKVFSREVDGSIYAQPLYVSDLKIGGQTRNVVFVATMHNSVYAFDADDPTASTPLWKRSFGSSIPLPDPNIGSGTSSYQDIKVEVGIMSTPVISPSLDALYVLPLSCDGPQCGNSCPNRACTSGYRYTLYKLDLTTGSILDSQAVSGSVPGQGTSYTGRFPDKCPATNGRVVFYPNQALQRAGLTLVGDNIYIGFAGFGDAKPYHGWVFGYRTSDLGQVGIFNTTPNGCAGGVWMSGEGLAADSSGHLYFSTGNGASHDKGGLAESIIKLDSNLQLVDSFTPCNYGSLNCRDLDLSSSGVFLLPDAGDEWLVGGGKEGKLYLLDRSDLGGYSPTDAGVRQSFCPGGDCGKCTDTPISCNRYSNVPPSGSGQGPIRGTPVYWNRDSGPLMYVWPQSSIPSNQIGLQAYRFDSGTNMFSSTPVSGNRTYVQYPGGVLSLSASGTGGSSTGILWATTALCNYAGAPNANWIVQPGVLHAFDASDLSTELWNSQQDPADKIKYFAKFTPPTVANGKVYVATQGAMTAQECSDQPSVGGPALAATDDHLVLGWTDESRKVHVRCSRDGRSFGTRLDLGARSDHAPDLAGSPSLGFAAWTDTAGYLNVASFSSCDAVKSRVRLDGNISSAPALSYGNGRLYLAWTDSEGAIRVKSSADRGRTFSDEVTLPGRSATAPALSYGNDRLYLLRTLAATRNRIEISESKDGIEFTSRRLLEDGSTERPAMLVGEAVHLAWKGIDGGLHLDSGGRIDSLGADPSLGITSASRPSLASFEDEVYVAWTRPDGAVMVGSTSCLGTNCAELLVYGLKSTPSADYASSGR